MRLAPVFAVECGSAWSVLAVAQDGLERRDEAEASLQKAIDILRSPAVADLAIASSAEGVCLTGGILPHCPACPFHLIVT